MTRFILPIILIGIAVAIFFTFTNPLYNNLGTLKTQLTSYNQALTNSNALENQRDALTAKENSFDPTDVARLNTLLPDDVDNIRLILEIENLATPYGMVLEDVKYDTDQTNSAKVNASGASSTTTPAVAAGTVTGGGTTTSNTAYGTWDLEFSTEGSYDNFINFLKDLEKNLRIVDVSSLSFSSDESAGSTPALSDIYKYSFTIQTYWLKN